MLSLSRLPLVKLTDSAGRTRADAKTTRRVVALADGGLWNNLGTQVVEDGFCGGEFQIEFADWRTETPRVAVINASKPHGGVRSWLFRVPLVGSLVALYRGMVSLSTNSIEPRVQALLVRRGAAIHDLATAIDLERKLGFGELSLLRTAEQREQYLAELVEQFARGERRSDDTAPTDRSMLKRLVRRWEHGFSRAPLVVSPTTSTMLGMEDLSAIATLKDTPLAASFALLTKSDAWTRLIADSRDGSTVKTTLGRIDRRSAFAVILAAYVNMFYWSGYWTPITPADVEQFAARVDDIARMTGVPRFDELLEMLKP